MRQNPSTFLFYPFILFLFISFAQSEQLCATQSNQMASNLAAPYTADITQTACVHFFQVPYVAAMQNKFLIMEIEFSTPVDKARFMPLLMADIIPPTASLNSGTITIDGNWVDSNGFMNRKLYHQIIIRPEDLSPADTYYFAMYRAYTAEPSTSILSYRVNIRTSPIFECPDACSGHGTCKLITEKCECDKGYFDQDCSVYAIEINLGNFGKKSINNYEWAYFYFNIKDSSNDLKILLEKGVGAEDISFLLNKEDDYTIPNRYQNNGKYQLSTDQNQGHLMMSKETLMSQQKDLILVGIYNSNQSSLVVQVSFEYYDDTSVFRIISLAVIATLSLLLLASWILFSILKLKDHREMEALIQEREGQKEEEKILSKKDINKFFPKKKFKEFNSQFPQTMCSICIDDFELEASCRQLYCDHIFHSNCIGAWLNQHHSCPNCKKEITKPAVEEFLKQKAHRKSQIAPSPVRLAVKNETRDQPNQETDQSRKGSLMMSPVRIDVRKYHRESILLRKMDREETKYDDEDIPMRRKSKQLTTDTLTETLVNELNTGTSVQSPVDEMRLRNIQRAEPSRMSQTAIVPVHRGSLVQGEIQSRVQNRLRRHSRAHVELPVGLHTEAEKSSFRPQ